MTDHARPPEAPLRVVVSGSRDWPEDKLWFVSQILVEQLPYRNALVIHGGARGVDSHVGDECVRLGFEQREMPADWDRHGKRAGMIRNAAMLDERPDLFIAFHWRGSRGTAHAIREAYKRGIPMQVYTEESLRPDIEALDMGDVE